MISSSLRFELSCSQCKHVKDERRWGGGGAAARFFMSTSHFTTTGVIKPTKLLRFKKKKQVNEFIKLKTLLIINLPKENVTFIVFHVKGVNKSKS